MKNFQLKVDFSVPSTRRPDGVSRLLSRGLFSIILLAIVFTTPAFAEGASSVTDDESVRRIVERAMAAVSLAEAEAARKVAEIQIRLAASEDSVYVLRRKISLFEAEALHAQSRGAQKDELIMRLESEKTALKFSVAQYLDDMEKMRRELKSNALLLDEARKRLAAAHGSRDDLEKSEDSLRDTVAILTMTVSSLNTDNVLLAEKVIALESENAGINRNFEKIKQRLEEEQRSGNAADLEAERRVFQARLEEERERHKVRLAMVTRELSDSIAILSAIVTRSAAEKKNLRDELERLLTVQTAEKEIESTDQNAREGKLKLVETELARIISALGGQPEDALGENGEFDMEEGFEVLRARIASLISEKESLAMSLVANRDEMISALETLKTMEAELRKAYQERDRLRNAEKVDGSSAVADFESTARIQECRDLLAEHEQELLDLRKLVRELTTGIADPGISFTEILPTPALASEERSALVAALNTSSEAELLLLPGIGQAEALAVIWYREAQGKIRTVEDLKFIPGFNDEKIEELKAYFRAKEEE